MNRIQISETKSGRVECPMKHDVDSTFSVSLFSLPKYNSVSKEENDLSYYMHTNLGFKRLLPL